ncbi:DUF2155 domain-containing protein [Candidatus Sneabacter namystus]|uniref:DUF2155 domain-containing protein n=1 Tax=Candidatus Sneabacter namystus TaxID=2601646 RepID=A0A5C0UJ29_9RICK|nr:DUF2155 domain-containing protein [Candidatus Sneabacter namystus]QEK39462.1 DUF2155 domain-containing protein [Candidatus Sneabacter namystus]
MWMCCKKLRHLTLVTVLLMSPFFCLAQENEDSEQEEQSQYQHEGDSEEDCAKSSDEDADNEAVDSSCLPCASATLLILNKVTAKRETIHLRVGESVRINNLMIKLVQCWQVLDPTRADNIATLEIYEASCRDENYDKLVFQGWVSQMYPGLSNLQHPNYVIALRECCP